MEEFSKNTLALGGLWRYDANDEDVQVGIAVVVEPLDCGDGVEVVAREIADGRGVLDAAPRFVRSQPMDALMDTVFVVPAAEGFEAALDEGYIRKPSTACGPLPNLECSEKPLDLTVELRMLGGAANDVDAHRANQFSEGFTELRTLVGDGETRYAKQRHGRPEHFQNGICRRRRGTDFERQ